MVLFLYPPFLRPGLWFFIYGVALSSFLLIYVLIKHIWQVLFLFCINTIDMNE